MQAARHVQLVSYVGKPQQAAYMAVRHGVYQHMFQAVQSAAAGVFPTQLAFSILPKNFCESQLHPF